MKHLFQNYEGETVAANTLRQAARYHDCTLGGADKPDDGWSKIPDDAVIPIHDLHGTGKTTRKRAKNWAKMFDEPTQISTTYT